MKHHSRLSTAIIAILLLSLLGLVLLEFIREEQPVYAGKPILTYFPSWNFDIKNSPTLRGGGGRGTRNMAERGGRAARDMADLSSSEPGPESFDWLMRVIRRED